MGPEKQIENQIRDYIEAHGGYVIKVWNGGIKLWNGKTAKSNNPGIADILACFGGRFLAVEVKSATGKASVAQTKFLEKVRQAGGIAVVARSVDDVRRAISLPIVDTLL